jgi:hypothetical protein
MGMILVSAEISKLHLEVERRGTDIIRKGLSKYVAREFVLYDIL